MKDIPRITYFLADDGACGWYRLTLPMLTLEKKKLAEVCCISKGDPSEKFEGSLAADLFVVPRIYEKNQKGLISILREAGKPVVIDYDDDLFNICPFSHHYEEFGTKEVVLNFQGEPLDLWIDGQKGFNIEANKEKLEGIRRACREADLITVTTDKLAETYREFNENVAVLPNCLRFPMWRKLPLKTHEPEIRLLWTGGASHYRDWCIVSDVLPLLMRDYPTIKLVIGGHKFDGTLKACPRDRIEYHAWTPITAHHLQTAILDADIGIIPLEDNDFNSRKSCIKWLEMSALSIPCVVSHVSPYKEIYDGENAVMIENNTAQGWYDGISTLIEDKMLRAKIGGSAYKYALGNFDIETQIYKWMEAYAKCLATVGV